jgi:hypothetical protein
MNRGSCRAAKHSCLFRWQARGITADLFLEPVSRTSIAAGYLSKSPKDVLVAKFGNLKIGSAAICYGTRMAKGFPKSVRMFYRGSRSRASNRFASNDAIICVVERHDHELGNLGHASSPLGEILDNIFADPLYLVLL